ncbi:MAG: aminotransferase class III-fold pyridoxal phosphate-dependent enzyme, partial [Acidimicrobiales bacterium]
MTDVNAELFERALEVIPGGVNSPVRAFNAVGGTPYFVAHADGAYVTDENGKQYIDMVQSYGAIILGHAHPGVVDAIARAAQDGTSYGAPTRREVELAERIVDLVPSCDRIRLVNSGTEATMSAVRLARGATGRDKILKFAGNYHGHADGLMAAAGSAVMGLGLPGSAGVPTAAVADTLVAPYNKVPTLDDSVAAVIIEPVAANMGLVVPTQEFLDGLRAECDRAGALLIFDEVITG